MMESLKNERTLVKLVRRFFENKNFTVIEEIPNMGQSVDLVALQGKKIVFIEAKMSDWKRAINQCKTHEAVADIIYIAIASKNVSPFFLNEAKKSGYGILHYNRQTCCIDESLTPNKNRKIWYPQREVLKNNIEKVKDEN